MADAVSAALAEPHHAVIEAGTGVGKSFAYLVPTILAATDPRNDDVDDETPQRIVISTHTISLQEQLIHKDLPFLNSVIPREFSAVLVKGRRNYLSQRRLNLALQRAMSLFVDDAEVDQLQEIKRWADQTEDGSLSDLPFRPQPSVWDEVASDSGNCLGRKCQHHADCFYFRARRRIQHAQILIVNHALFFTDLALRRRDACVLPDYQAVVFDEAHTLESVAASHLGVSVTSGQINYALNKLYNDRTNRGLLVYCKMGDLQQQVDRCRHTAEALYTALGQWYVSQSSANGRVTAPNLIDNHLSTALNHLANAVLKAGRKCPDKSARPDFMAAHERLTYLADSLEMWARQKLENAVYWVDHTTSRRGQSPRISLAACPIDIGPILRKELYATVPTTIMTSATLAVGNPPSFDFFRARVGLTQGAEKRLGSPFDYRRQAQLILVPGMPDPSSAREHFEQRCGAMIRRYVERTDGHAFVLFTSYSLMRRIAADLTTWLTRQDLALYSQAEGLPRHLMLEQFKRNPRSVLFGTDSFWQGVDVPGDALQNVIITKLPFSVPDQPLIQARLDAIREAGGSPFMEYQVPEAVIKLRQGFGRLIRTQRDHGMVVILDPRVRSKRYGRIFIESLPQCDLVEEPAD